MLTGRALALSLVAGSAPWASLSGYWGPSVGRDFGRHSATFGSVLRLRQASRMGGCMGHGVPRVYTVEMLTVNSRETPTLVGCSTLGASWWLGDVKPRGALASG